MTSPLDEIGELIARVDTSMSRIRSAENGHSRPIWHGPPIVTATELASRTFPDPRWAVPGVLPDGATLLVGAPKKGKSWLLLGLGVAIAAGGYALGKVLVEGGDVLLLCLEDNQRRLQERLWRVLDGESAPDRLYLVTEWPRLDEGADAALDAWLTEHPATRLVGIDVLARLRPPSSGNGNLYQLDYSILARLKAVADVHGVALVAVHHSRKAAADDPLDTVSGTAGLAGAADDPYEGKRSGRRQSLCAWSGCTRGRLCARLRFRHLHLDPAR